MRKPYGEILVASIVLTVLYFFIEERPSYITYEEDQRNMLLWGIVYVVLLFSIFSAIYIFFRKRR